jgi:hypothetical protein
LNTQKPIDGDFKVPFRSFTFFLLVTFGLTWGILGLYIGFPDGMTEAFGVLTGQHPLFFLCVYAPAIAAFILVGRHGGLKGLRSFFSRLGLWRCSPFWYVFLLVGVPLVFYLGAALKGTIREESLPFASFGALTVTVASAAIKGPVEEFGWRGFALPLLQRRFAPVWAGLIIGVVWGFWHTPAFLLSGTQQSAWSFTPFFIGCIAISMIATALFNASRGSILLAAVFHFQLMNPIWPDAQPYDTFILVFLAVVLLWIYRKAMFSLAGNVREIIPASGSNDESPHFKSSRNKDLCEREFRKCNK